MSNTNTFTLREIAEKKNSSNIEIVIPSLQRGLVWKPKQIEFLWDSILRFFPIGGFVIAKNNEKKYDLMDGQQRFNAIMLGFNEPSEQDDIVLWLDINPIKEPNITRKFFIKATTKSHPWGYKNDENCSLLSAEERRNALKEFFGEEKNIYNDNTINLLQTYPYSYKRGADEEALNFPVPFSYFLNGEFSKGWKEFYDSIESKIKDTKLLKWKENYWKKENINLLKTFTENNFYIFKSVFYSEIKESDNIYRVPFSELPENTIEDETNSKDDVNNMTDLEVLFNRLNTGGTRISQDDLTYSAIKAYWGKINEKNDIIAKGFMPPQKLVMLLFRLIITLDNLNKTQQIKFESNLSIKRIREIAKKEQDSDLRNAIEEFYNNEAKSVVDKLKKCYKSIPSYNVMCIVRDKPDIILLGLYLAMKGFLDQINFCGLSLLLYWFCYTPYQAINLILEEIYNANSDTINKIKIGIRKCFEKNFLPKIFSEQSIRETIFQNNILTESKDILNELEEYWFISTVFYNKTFLLYAQKDFLDNHFKYYNPADTISWEDHNRPWDYDHIIPRAWSYGHSRTEAKLLVDEWLNTIGNFAAIPFEDNRAKNKYSDFTYYNNNYDDLLFDKRFEKEITDKVAQDINIATKFKNLVFERILKIYAKCYNSFKEFLPDASMIISESEESDEELFSQFLDLIIQEIKTQYHTENTHIEYALYNQQFEVLNSKEAAEKFLNLDFKAKVIDVSTPLDDESKRVDIEFIVDKNQFIVQGGLRNPYWIQDQLFGRNIKTIDFVNKNQEYHAFKNASAEKRKVIVKDFLDSCDKLLYLFSNL